MPEGGTLTIYAEKEDKKTKIYFKDTGLGIPKGNIEKYFKRYLLQKPRAQVWG